MLNSSKQKLKDLQWNDYFKTSQSLIVHALYSTLLIRPSKNLQNYASNMLKKMQIMIP